MLKVEKKSDGWYVGGERYASQTEATRRLIALLGGVAPKTNPSVVRFLDFDRKKQTADAMLARDPVVEREWYEENTTYPLWNVSRVAENEFVVYRHDAPGYGERVHQTDRFSLALRAVERDAEKWLQDEPYRLMLSKHGLRP